MRSDVSSDDDLVLEPDGAGGWVLLLGGRPQSHVDADDPTRLFFDYVRRLGDVVDLVTPPGERLRVLHVGGGALTLARYVAATRPGSRQVVLEPHEALTALVRERLPLPARSGVTVRPVDGATGLHEVRNGWADVVLLDAYDERGEVPASLRTDEALAELGRVVSPGGVVAANVADRAPWPVARGMVAGLRRAVGPVTCGAEPATLRGRRPGNLVLVAVATRERGPGGGAARLAVGAWAARAAGGAAPYRVLDVDATRDRLG